MSHKESPRSPKSTVSDSCCCHPTEQVSCVRFHLSRLGKIQQAGKAVSLSGVLQPCRLEWEVCSPPRSAAASSPSLSPEDQDWCFGLVLPVSRECMGVIIPSQYGVRKERIHCFPPAYPFIATSTFLLLWLPLPSCQTHGFKTTCSFSGKFPWSFLVLGPSPGIHTSYLYFILFSFYSLSLIWGMGDSHVFTILTVTRNCEKTSNLSL